MHVSMSTGASAEGYGSYDLVDSEDGADVDTCVDVAATVQGIEHDAVFALVALLHNNGVLQLFGNKDCGFARCAEGIHHDIIGQDIQLLLLFALDIGLTGQTDAVEIR